MMFSCTAQFISDLVGNPKTRFIMRRLIYYLYLRPEAGHTEKDESFLPVVLQLFYI